MRYFFLLICCAALASATEIPDPVKFVSDVYQKYIERGRAHKDYDAPTDIYTPRLKRLFDDDKRKANGEVGCMDFDFWVNGQDWRLSKLNVTGENAAGHPEQKTVIATFTNLGTPMELHFHFLQQRGKWLLDDVECVKGPEKWTLSKLLSCWP